jgi:hypothetical protein
MFSKRVEVLCVESFREDVRGHVRNAVTSVGLKTAGGLTRVKQVWRWWWKLMKGGGTKKGAVSKADKQEAVDAMLYFAKKGKSKLSGGCY